MVVESGDMVIFGDKYGPGQRSVVPNWGHLHCFLGGTIGMMAKYAEDKQTSMKWAAGIATTCHRMYAETSSGLGASGISVQPGGKFHVTSADYLLRPEAIETWFYMWRLTKDQKYRDWAWQAFVALKRNCRTKSGYAGLRNVNQMVNNFNDNQETFLLAETFKYLYLIFADDSLLDLDKYVFNTEAHPFPVLDPEEKEEYRNLYKVMQQVPLGPK